MPACFPLDMYSAIDVPARLHNEKSAIAETARAAQLVPSSIAVDIGQRMAKIAAQASIQAKRCRMGANKGLVSLS